MIRNGIKKASINRRGRYSGLLFLLTAIILFSASCGPVEESEVRETRDRRETKASREKSDSFFDNLMGTSSKETTDSGESSVAELSQIETTETAEPNPSSETSFTIVPTEAPTTSTETSAEPPTTEYVEVFDGYITIILRDEAGAISSEKTIGYHMGDSLEKLLTESFYNVQIEAGRIVSIESLSDTMEGETAIVVWQDNLLLEGVDSIALSDGMILNVTSARKEYLLRGINESITVYSNGAVITSYIEYVYDEHGWLVEERGTNCDGRWHNNPSWKCDSVLYEYDDEGKILKKVYQYAETQDEYYEELIFPEEILEARYEYNAAGQLLRISVYKEGVLQEYMGYECAYDAQERILWERELHQDFNEGIIWDPSAVEYVMYTDTKTDYQYNDDGSWQVEYHYDGSSMYVPGSGGGSPTIRIVYDTQGREIIRNGYNSSVETYYNEVGQIERIIDYGHPHCLNRDQIYEEQYNNMLYPYGPVTKNEYTYDYNEAGYLIRDKIYFYEYDPTGRVIKKSDYKGNGYGNYEYEYDTAGNLIREKKTNSYSETVTEYSYEAIYIPAFFPGQE